MWDMLLQNFWAQTDGKPIKATLESPNLCTSTSTTQGLQCSNHRTIGRKFLSIISILGAHPTPQFQPRSLCSFLRRIFLGLEAPGQRLPHELHAMRRTFDHGICIYLLSKHPFEQRKVWLSSHPSAWQSLYFFGSCTNIDMEQFGGTHNGDMWWRSMKPQAIHRNRLMAAKATPRQTFKQSSYHWCLEKSHSDLCTPFLCMATNFIGLFGWHEHICDDDCGKRWVSIPPFCVAWWAQAKHPWWCGVWFIQNSKKMKSLVAQTDTLTSKKKHI